MILISETILPVFLIVVIGLILRHSKLISADFWPHFNTFGFYVLFPALVFQAISTADFSTLAMENLAYASLITFGALPAIVLAAWPIFKRYHMPPSTYTSVFQTTSRWHGFMALAIAEKLYGQTGLTFVAVVMLIIILPINITNITVLIYFNEEKKSLKSFITKMITNPIIIAALMAVIFQLFNIKVYAPISQSIDFIAQATLGMGLLMIGAGLSIHQITHPGKIIIFSVLVKLIALPIIAFSVGTWFNFNPVELTLFTLLCAVPTATNGYVLAQKMGGNAPLYASIASLQVVGSFITIPVVLLIINQVLK